MHKSEKGKWSCFSHVWLFMTPWTAAYQAPPSMRFSRQEYWSGLPLPSPKHHTSFYYFKFPLGSWFCDIRVVMSELLSSAPLSNARLTKLKIGWALLMNMDGWFSNLIWCICSGMPHSWPSSSLTLLSEWLLMFLLLWCDHCFLQVTGNHSSSLVALLGNLLEFNSLLGESRPTQMNAFADLGSAPLGWLLMHPGAY